MKKQLKTYTLDQIKDEFIGKPGTVKRREYERELKKDVEKHKR